jgi:hypothetical protein
MPVNCAYVLLHEVNMLSAHGIKGAHYCSACLIACTPLGVLKAVRVH